MSSRTIEDTLAILGGAAVGAAVMYFLDPDTGERRRNQVAKAAGGACGNASDMRDAAASRAQHAASRFGGRVRQAHESASQYAARLAAEAHDLAADLTHRATRALPNNPSATIASGQRAGARWFDRVSSEAHDQVEHLRDAGQHLWERARGLISHVPDMAAHQSEHLRGHLADRTDDWRKAAAGHVSRASHAAQSWLGHEEHEGFGVGTILSSTVGCLAVGAGAMYFFDPEKGPNRRSWIADQCAMLVRRTGRTMHGIGQDVANQLGVASSSARSSARNLAGQARVNTEQLISRIRGEMGLLSARAQSVQLMADADGTVTVTGNVGRDEVDYLLSLLHRVPGVTHVINRMTVGETAGGVQSR